MANIDWSNPKGWNEAEWESATWGDRFTVINPFFWR